VTSGASKLRPGKVASAVRRRWFERSLGDLKLEPGHEIVSLGTDYGGWHIPDGVLNAESVCYCIGAGADISFDLELIHRYGARVRSFDPVQAYEARALKDSQGEPRFTFIRAAVATCDGPIRLQRTHHPGSASVSAAGLYDTDSWFEAPGRTLSSLMGELGDTRIDLLKLDVEGAEYDIVPPLDLAGMGVRIFSVQLHHTGSVRQARSLIAGVCGQGFHLVGERPVVKVTFLRDP